MENVVRERQLRNSRNFPATAVSILNTWLYEHRYSPYPTGEEKNRLASATGLTPDQVKNTSCLIFNRNMVISEY